MMKGREVAIVFIYLLRHILPHHTLHRETPLRNLVNDYYLLHIAPGTVYLSTCSVQEEGNGEQLPVI